MSIHNSLSPEQVVGILDIADNAIICTDAGGTIVFFNQGAERIFGWRAGEVVGKELSLLIPERFRSGHGQRMAGFHHGDATARRMGERGTIYALRKDGVEFPAEASISRSQSGGEWVLTAILQDISERRAYERELEQAKEKAEAAMLAKGVFLANMSHEIRTPLNAVIGMTTLLLNTGLDDEQRDHAQTIRNSGEALLAIINDLLDYSKIDVGRLDLERQAFEIRRSVDDALDLVAPGAGGKQIELMCTIGPEVPEMILADATRLRQVLVNLLSNAVKFTQRGEVVLDVKAKWINAQQHMLSFAVWDSGIGIPAHRLDDIFDSFTQVDASTTRQYGGTGLGLTISRRLAQIMGGDITVESEAGRGSCFTLSILADAADGKSSSELLQKRAAPLAGRRILIIDDNTTNLRILRMQALQWGMKAAAVASAAEALDLVAGGEAFEVAVIDLNMPDMLGTTLARAIGQVRPANPPPVVLLMPIGERVQLQTGDDLHFAARLSKPVKPAMLLDALLKALGVYRGVAPVPASTQLADQAGVQILVAEDNAINQKVIQQQLRRLGYQADIVGNGAEAVAALERQQYGVVLMDVQMPVLDGIEATRLLRARARGSDLPYIVAMTANALPGDRERCLAAGMDAYLPKPVIFDDLRQALALAIDTVTARRAPAAIDPARIRELAADDGHDGGVLDQVVGMFLQEVPGLLEKAAQAVRGRDSAGLAGTAHYLLSSIDAVGATRMRDPCSRLQVLGNSGRFDTALELLAALAREFDAARLALLALQRRG